MPLLFANRIVLLPGMVRRLEKDDVAQLQKHLQRLDGPTLRDRFGPRKLSTEFLAAYGRKCFWDGSVVTGFFDRGILRGAAELHPGNADGLLAPMSEAAISVEVEWQGRGAGTRLMRRLIMEADAAGASSIELWVRSGNLPMRALLRRFNAEEENVQGDIRAVIGTSMRQNNELRNDTGADQ